MPLLNLAFSKIHQSKINQITPFNLVLIKKSFLCSSHYFFSFTENAYEISIVASKEIIDNDFIPSLIMAQCHDMRSSSDSYRVLQVDDEGGQGNLTLKFRKNCYS